GPNATDEENLRLLIERVRAVGPLDRSARYRCVAVCAWPDGQYLSAEGSCEGRLVTQPRGSGGFGYDPAFVPSGERRTMPELSATHGKQRGRARCSAGDRPGWKSGGPSHERKKGRKRRVRATSMPADRH